MAIFQYIPGFLINLIAGIVGIVIVLWIERQRRPKLSISVDSPGTIDERDPLKRRVTTFLHANVTNNKIPRWISWAYDGDPALSCEAWVSFFHLDGQPVFSKDMVARWAESPEPQLITFDIEGGKAAKIVGYQNTIDIPACDSTQVDLVSRIKGDENCYGWSNESYLYNWKHPKWILGPQRYLAVVRVKTGGRQFKEAFLIINDVPFSDFRLELAPAEYRDKVI